MSTEIKLQFSDGFDLRDFEDFADLPEWWNASEEEREDFFVRFKAYGTADELMPRETELRRSGYEFECYVELQKETATEFESWDLAHFPARNREEAEHLLQLAADALYR